MKKMKYFSKILLIFLILTNINSAISDEEKSESDLDSSTNEETEDVKPVNKRHLSFLSSEDYDTFLDDDILKSQTSSYWDKQLDFITSGHYPNSGSPDDYNVHHHHHHHHPYDDHNPHDCGDNHQHHHIHHQEIPPPTYTATDLHHHHHTSNFYNPHLHGGLDSSMIVIKSNNPKSELTKVSLKKPLSEILGFDNTYSEIVPELYSSGHDDHHPATAPAPMPEPEIKPIPPKPCDDDHKSEQPDQVEINHDDPHYKDNLLKHVLKIVNFVQQKQTAEYGKNIGSSSSDGDAKKNLSETPKIHLYVEKPDGTKISPKDVQTEDSKMIHDPLHKVIEELVGSYDKDHHIHEDYPTQLNKPVSSEEENKDDVGGKTDDSENTEDEKPCDDQPDESTKDTPEDTNKDEGEQPIPEEHTQEPETTTKAIDQDNHHNYHDGEYEHALEQDEHLNTPLLDEDSGLPVVEPQQIPYKPDHDELEHHDGATVTTMEHPKPQEPPRILIEKLVLVNGKPMGAIIGEGIPDNPHAQEPLHDLSQNLFKTIMQIVTFAQNKKIPVNDNGCHGHVPQEPPVTKAPPEGNENCDGSGGDNSPGSGNGDGSNGLSGLINIGADVDILTANKESGGAGSGGGSAPTKDSSATGGLLNVIADIDVLTANKKSGGAGSGGGNAPTKDSSTPGGLLNVIADVDVLTANKESGGAGSGRGNAPTKDSSATGGLLNVIADVDVLTANKESGGAGSGGGSAPTKDSSAPGGLLNVIADVDVLTANKESGDPNSQGLGKDTSGLGGLLNIAADVDILTANEKTVGTNTGDAGGGSGTNPEEPSKTPILIEEIQEDITIPEKSIGPNRGKKPMTMDDLIQKEFTKENKYSFVPAVLDEMRHRIKSHFSEATGNRRPTANNANPDEPSTTIITNPNTVIKSDSVNAVPYLQEMRGKVKSEFATMTKDSIGSGGSGSGGPDGLLNVVADINVLTANKEGPQGSPTKTGGGRGGGLLDVVADVDILTANKEISEGGAPSGGSQAKPKSTGGSGGRLLDVVADVDILTANKEVSEDKPPSGTGENKGGSEGSNGKPAGHGNLGGALANVVADVDILTANKEISGDDAPRSEGSDGSDKKPEGPGDLRGTLANVIADVDILTANKEVSDGGASSGGSQAKPKSTGGSGGRLLDVVADVDILTANKEVSEDKPPSGTGENKGGSEGSNGKPAGHENLGGALANVVADVNILTANKEISGDDAPRSEGSDGSDKKPEGPGDLDGTLANVIADIDILTANKEVSDGGAPSGGSQAKPKSTGGSSGRLLDVVADVDILTANKEVSEDKPPSGTGENKGGSEGSNGKPAGHENLGGALANVVADVDILTANKEISGDDAPRSEGSDGSDKKPEGPGDLSGTLANVIADVDILTANKEISEDGKPPESGAPTGGSGAGPTKAEDAGGLEGALANVIADVDILTANKEISKDAAPSQGAPSGDSGGSNTKPDGVRGVSDALINVVADVNVLTANEEVSGDAAPAKPESSSDAEGALADVIADVNVLTANKETINNNPAGKDETLVDEEEDLEPSPELNSILDERKRRAEDLETAASEAFATFALPRRRLRNSEVAKSENQIKIDDSNQYNSEIPSVNNSDVTNDTKMLKETIKDEPSIESEIFSQIVQVPERSETDDLNTNFRENLDAINKEKFENNEFDNIPIIDLGTPESNPKSDVIISTINGKGSTSETHLPLLDNSKLKIEIDNIKSEDFIEYDDSDEKLKSNQSNINVDFTEKLPLNRNTINKTIISNDESVEEVEENVKQIPNTHNPVDEMTIENYILSQKLSEPSPILSEKPPMDSPPTEAENLFQPSGRSSTLPPKLESEIILEPSPEEDEISEVFREPETPSPVTQQLSEMLQILSRRILESPPIFPEILKPASIPTTPLPQIDQLEVLPSKDDNTKNGNSEDSNQSNLTASRLFTMLVPTNNASPPPLPTDNTFVESEVLTKNDHKFEVLDKDETEILAKDEQELEVSNKNEDDLEILTGNQNEAKMLHQSENQLEILEEKQNEDNESEILNNLLPNALDENHNDVLSTILPENQIAPIQDNFSNSELENEQILSDGQDNRIKVKENVSPTELENEPEILPTENINSEPELLENILPTQKPDSLAFSNTEEPEVKSDKELEILPKLKDDAKVIEDTKTESKQIPENDPFEDNIPEETKYYESRVTAPPLHFLNSHFSSQPLDNNFIDVDGSYDHNSKKDFDAPLGDDQKRTNLLRSYDRKIQQIKDEVHSMTNIVPNQKNSAKPTHLWEAFLAGFTHGQFINKLPKTESAELLPNGDILPKFTKEQDHQESSNVKRDRREEKPAVYHWFEDENYFVTPSPYYYQVHHNIEKREVNEAETQAESPQPENNSDNNSNSSSNCKKDKDCVEDCTHSHCSDKLPTEIMNNDPIFEYISARFMKKNEPKLEKEFEDTSEEFKRANQKKAEEFVKNEPSFVERKEDDSNKWSCSLGEC